MNLDEIKQTAKSIVEASYQEEENQLYIKELATKIKELAQKEIKNV